MRAKSILVDIDGVLASFSEYFEEVAKLPRTPSGYRTVYNPWGKPIEEFDVDLGYHFWRDLPIYPWAHELVNLVERYDPHYRFITAAVHNGQCLAGKYDWVRDHFGNRAVERLIVVVNEKKMENGGPKTFAARPGSLLIDDRDKNCAQWEAAGGQAYRWKERTSDMIEESRKELTALEKVLKGET